MSNNRFPDDTNFVNTILVGMGLTKLPGGWIVFMGVSLAE